jgi:hypothetical protein
MECALQDFYDLRCAERAQMDGTTWSVAGNSVAGNDGEAGQQNALQFKYLSFGHTPQLRPAVDAVS